jgi:hypothetical protein
MAATGAFTMLSSWKEKEAFLNSMVLLTPNQTLISKLACRFLQVEALNLKGKNCLSEMKV